LSGIMAATTLRQRVEHQVHRRQAAVRRRMAEMAATRILAARLARGSTITSKAMSPARTITRAELRRQTAPTLAAADRAAITSMAARGTLLRPRAVRHQARHRHQARRRRHRRRVVASRITTAASMATSGTTRKSLKSRLTMP